MAMDGTLTTAKATFCGLSHALAPVVRLVAVSDGLASRGVISTCIVSGPCASFLSLAKARVSCVADCSGEVSVRGSPLTSNGGHLHRRCVHQGSVIWYHLSYVNCHYEDNVSIQVERWLHFGSEKGRAGNGRWSPAALTNARETLLLVSSFSSAALLQRLSSFIMACLEASEAEGPRMPNQTYTLPITQWEMWLARG